MWLSRLSEVPFMPDNPLDIPYQAPSVFAHLSDTQARVEITPNDPKLAFDLLVPKTWAVSSEVGPVRHVLVHATRLCLFPAADSGGAVIAVTAVPCPFDVPIDSWALLSIAYEGWSVVASRWFPGPSGLFFDVTATRMIEGVEH